MMACAGAITANSAKVEQRKLFMDQPRLEMGERAFPITVAAACATDTKSMLTMAVIALRTIRTNRRGGLFSYRHFVP